MGLPQNTTICKAINKFVYLVIALFFLFPTMAIGGPAFFGGGTGDVESVGDATSGATFDGSSDGGSYLRIYDGDSNYGEIQVPNVASEVIFTIPGYTMSLPSAEGTSGWFLKTNADGTTQWAVAAGGGTLTTLKKDDAGVGDADIVVIDFGIGFTLTESPDTEMNITFDLTPSSGNATLEATEAALQVKYDSTDFGEGSSGLTLAASPTIATGLLIGSDPADTGTIRLPLAGSIVFEDGTEGAITHVDDYGFSFNVDLEAADGNTAFIIRSDNEAADTLELQAMDVDGSYTSLVTLTSHASEPTLTLASTGASTYVSSGGTVTVESVVFTGGALSAITTASLSHTAPDITLSDSDDAAGTGNLAFVSANTRDIVATLQADIAGSATTFITLDGTNEKITLGKFLDTYELGHATDTTIARVSAGVVSIEGNNIYVAGGTDVADGDVADDITITAGSQIESGNPAFTTVELGHASDSTIARSGAGTLTIEGNELYRVGGTDVADGDVANDITITAGSQIESGNPAFTTIELGHADDTTLARGAAGAATVEGDYIILSGDTLTGDVTGTFDVDGSTALTIADSVAVTSWTLTTPSVTNGITITGADASPNANGKLVYDNVVAGLHDGAFAYYGGGDTVYTLAAYVTVPGDAEDDYVLAYDMATDLLYFKADADSAGAPELQNIAAPTAAWAITLQDTEIVTWTTETTATDFLNIDATGAFGDISIVVIEQKTGDATDGTLLELTTADADVDHLFMSCGALDYVTHKIVDAGTYTIDVASNGTASVAFVDPVSITGAVTNITTLGLSHTAPGITLEDTDDAAGTGNLLFASSQATRDIVATIQVDINNSAVTFLTLDGTNEKITLGKYLDTFELGHASDTTISRSAAGDLDIEGVTVLLEDASIPLTSNWDVGAYMITATVFLPDTAADATGEIGFTGGAYNLYNVDDSLTITNAANVWTFGSTGDTFTFTPAVTFTAAPVFSDAPNSLVALGVNATESEIDTPLDGASVTLTEFQELETIGDVTISAGQWGYLGAANQAIATTDTVTFSTVTVTTEVYGAGWNADNTTATKDSIYDKIEAISGDIISVGDCSSGAALDGTSDGGTEFSLWDGSHKLTFDTTDISADATIVFGGDTNNLYINNGTAILDIDASATLNIDKGLTVGTNAGTLNFTAGSKTLSVEDDATVSQDYSSDASPTFATLNVSVGVDAVGAVDMDYGSADVTDHTFVADGGTVVIDGTITGTAAAPALTLEDSSAAAGTGTMIFASSGAYDVVGTIQVDVAGSATSYVEIDGVSETIDLLQNIVITDSKTLTFDESGADPNDADVVVSGADGVLTIASLNGAQGDQQAITIDLDQTDDTIIVGATNATIVDFGSEQVAAGSFDASEGNITNVGQINVDTIDADAAGIAIGTGSDQTLILDSSDWKIDATGAISYAAWDCDNNNTLTNVPNSAIKWADIDNLADEGALVIADESADTSCNVLFVTAATGNLAAKSGTNLTFNSSTGELEATIVSAVTALYADTQGGADIGSTTLQFNDLFLDDTGKITLGDDGDVTITHVPDTGILMELDDSIAFGDAAVYIESDADSYMDFVADGGFRFYDAVNDGSPLLAIGAAAAERLEIVATYEAGGQLIESVAFTTKTADTDANDGEMLFYVDEALEFSINDTGILIADAGTIGSASSTSAITIASTGIVTFVDDILIKDTGTIGSASDTDAISISSTGVIDITNVTEASAIGTAALTVDGGLGVAKDIWVGDDVTLDSDSCVLTFGDGQDVTLTHVNDKGLQLNLGFSITDDQILAIGGNVTTYDWAIEFDDSVDDQLLIHTTYYGTAAKIADPLVQILADFGTSNGTNMVANQQIFGIAKGTQAANVDLFYIDEDGDVYIAGDIITQSSTDPSIVFDESTASDTDWWAGINADQEGDNDDNFEIGIGTTPGTTAKWTLDPSGNSVAVGTSTATSFVLEGGTHDTTITAGTPTASKSYQWPLTDGTSGQALTTNASAVLSWTSLTATAAGSDTYIQWKGSTGALTAEAAFTYEDTANTLNITQAASNPTITTGDGSYTWGHTPQVGIEGVLEVDGNIYGDAGIVLGAAAAVAGEIGFSTNSFSFYGANSEDLEINVGTAANTCTITSNTAVSSLDIQIATLTVDALVLSSTLSGVTTATLTHSAPAITLDDSDAAAGTGNLLFASTGAHDVVGTIQADIAGSATTFISVDGVAEEVLFGKKIDLTSLGIENCGAIGDDAAFAIVSSGSTVTVESVVFTGGAISSATTLAMAGALSGATTVSLSHTAPDITLSDSDNAAGTGNLLFASAHTQDVVGTIQADIGGSATTFLSIDGVNEEVLFGKKADLATLGIENVGAVSGVTTLSITDDMTVADTKSIKSGASASDYFSIETTDDVGDTPVQVEAMRVTVSGDADAALVEIGDTGAVSPKIVTYLQAAPDAMANEGYSGTVITGLNAGEAIDQGNLVYWDATEVEWMEADADEAGHWPARGVALTTGSNGNPLDVLVQGIMRHDDWVSVFTVGGPVYLSDDPGDNDGVTVTAPATSTDCVQLVGWAITVDEVYFNFSGHYLEVE